LNQLAGVDVSHGMCDPAAASQHDKLIAVARRTTPAAVHRAPRRSIGDIWRGSGHVVAISGKRNCRG